MAGIRIGLIGCGRIGKSLAAFIDKEDGLQLSWVFDLDEKKARELLKKVRKKPMAAKSFDEMTECDLFIEAANRDAVREYAEKALERADLMVISSAAFLDRELYDKVVLKSSQTGKRLYLASGAAAGLDGIRAAAVGSLGSVTITLRKPPQALEGSPYVITKEISTRSIRKPTVIFDGSISEAAEWFPENLTAAIALTLGWESANKIRVRMIADPFAKMASNEIEAEGAFGRMRTVTEYPLAHDASVPSLDAASAIAALKGIKGRMVIGT